MDDLKRLNDGGDLRAIFFNRDNAYSEYFICAVLNSFMMDGYHKRHTKLKRGGYYEYLKVNYRNYPSVELTSLHPQMSVNSLHTKHAYRRL